jgi:NTE family protein
VLWRRLPELGVLGNWLTDARALVRLRTHVRSHESLRRLALEGLGAETFEELAVPFQCVAASIERAAEHWFSSGPLVDAILASASVPGLLPPIEIDGEHFVDGGIVNSIPIGRAVELGADEIYVLHVGRIERPLEVPRTAAGRRPRQLRDLPPPPIRPRAGRRPRGRGCARPADGGARPAALERTVIAALPQRQRR